jgi:carbamoyl-phosphate synthase large subunit
MRMAVDYGVPYITTLAAAKAAALAIEAIGKSRLTLEPLGHYLGTC